MLIFREADNFGFDLQNGPNRSMLTLPIVSGVENGIISRKRYLCIFESCVSSYIQYSRLHVYTYSYMRLMTRLTNCKLDTVGLIIYYVKHEILRRQRNSKQLKMIDLKRRLSPLYNLIAN